MMHVLMIEDTEAVCEMMEMFLKTKAGKQVSIMMEKKASMLLWKINPNGAL